MMKNKLLVHLVLLLSFCSLTSCITTKEVRYMQPSESLVINEEGLVPYSYQDYRITQNDMLNLNIITTPKGDAAQFYSTLYATSEGGNAATTITQSTSGYSGNGNTANGSGVNNERSYLMGLKLDSKGEVYVFGIGYLKAEGRTLEDLQQEIQEKVNENFLEGKSEVRLNLNGIKYYILGDIETTQLTGEKVSYVPHINIMEALAQNGGLNRTIDRKSVTLQRRYPEGIKTVRLDLTREDIMNSPYYWIQNGDMIYLNTQPKSFYGFGKEPLQTLTTGVSVLTTALSVYLLISRFGN